MPPGCTKPGTAPWLAVNSSLAPPRVIWDCDNAESSVACTISALSDERPSKFDPLAQHNKNQKQRLHLQAQLKSKGISHLTGGNKRQVLPNQGSTMDNSGKKSSSGKKASSKKNAATAEFKASVRDAQKQVRKKQQVTDQQLSEAKKLAEQGFMDEDTPDHRTSKAKRDRFKASDGKVTPDSVRGHAKKKAKTQKPAPESDDEEEVEPEYAQDQYPDKRPNTRSKRSKDQDSEDEEASEEEEDLYDEEQQQDDDGDESDASECSTEKADDADEYYEIRKDIYKRRVADLANITKHFKLAERNLKISQATIKRKDKEIKAVEDRVGRRDATIRGKDETINALKDEKDLLYDQLKEAQAKLKESHAKKSKSTKQEQSGDIVEKIDDHVKDILFRTVKFASNTVLNGQTVKIWDALHERYKWDKIPGLDRGEFVRIYASAVQSKLSACRQYVQSRCLDAAHGTFCGSFWQMFVCFGLFDPKSFLSFPRIV